MKGSGHLVFCLLLVFTSSYPATVYSSNSDAKAQKVLRDLFKQFSAYAAVTQKSWKVPDEFLSKNSSLIQKLEALLRTATEIAGGEFDEVFGSYVDVTKDLNTLREFSKTKKGNPENILSIVNKYFKRYLKKFTPTSTCEKVKMEGQIPEVRLNHAPIKLFGYPHFDPNSRETILRRKLPLNVINKFLIPIKVGSYDYVVQGRVSKVLEFFDCFAEYSVIAETLFSDGHWGSKIHKGEKPLPLTVQVQGTMRGGSVGEILVREALERVVRAVDFGFDKKGTLSTLVKEALTGELTVGEYLTPGNAIQHLRNYAGYTESGFLALLNEMAEAKDMQGRLCAFYRYMRKSQQNAEEWVQPEAVSHHDRISVRLTTYPQPNHNNKATRQMQGSQVTLGDIADALREINWESM